MSDSEDEFDEPTTTLADDFLADLEELDSGDEEENEEDDDPDAMDEDLEGLVKDATVKGVAKLMASEAFTSVVAEMQQFTDADEANTREIVGPLEEDDEYKLIVRMNELSTDIDNEIMLIHKFVRDLYATKFPELENLIGNPVDYAKVVKEIGNEMDLTMVNLDEVLPSATIMVVSVTGSTTPGKPLSPDELKRCMDGIDEMLTVFDHRMKILNYVESRMTKFAPNISALIGASLSARMIGLAGGLTSLSKIPSCNVQALGTSRKNLQGLASKAGGGEHSLPSLLCAALSLRPRRCPERWSARPIQSDRHPAALPQGWVRTMACSRTVRS